MHAAELLASVAESLPAAPMSARREALAAREAPPDHAPALGRRRDEITLSDFATRIAEGFERAFRRGERMSEGLADGVDAARAAGDRLRQAFDEAMEEVRLLLRNLGFDEPTAGKVKSQLGSQVEGRLRDAVHRPAGGFVMQSRSLALSVEKIDITIRQGDTAIDVSFQSVSFTYVERTVVGLVVGREDPLILDMAGDGFALAPNAATFDLDGDGRAERTAWVRGDDALLAFDRDGDGRITSGRELFGDQNGAADGFAELARYDDNGDGAIDADDAIYPSLLLLREGGDVTRLADEGVARIRLDLVKPLNRTVEGGLWVAASVFERGDGSRGTVGEALLDTYA